MKNPWEWAEEDLGALVAEKAQESLTLEYKGSDALAKEDASKNELSKDVSAFANSAGGTIVYGIRENAETHVPEYLDQGTDPSVITREWVEQVINSRIQQRIDGVRISEVPLTKSSPGRVAFVVHVPQSTRAPHQAADKKFYRRFNFQSVPMEEYEIRDLSRRQSAPDVGVGFSHVLDGLATGRDPRYKPFRVVLTNDSHVPCEVAVIELRLDCGLKLANQRWLKVDYNATVQDTDRTIPVVAYKFGWAVRQGIPAFRDCPVPVEVDQLIVDSGRTKPGSYLVWWRVVAPMAEPREAYTFFDWDGKGGYGFRFKRYSEEEALAEPGLHWLAKGDVITFDQ